MQLAGSILLMFGCASLLACRDAGAARPTPVYGYEVVHAYPHDPNAFTQGLVYLNGVLYEGTGLNGKSSVRTERLETGEVLQRHAIPDEFFGEGIAVWGGRIFELTWKAERGFVYDQRTLDAVGSFAYRGEGWGLTHDGKRLIESDGSAYLRFWDTRSFAELGRVLVTDEGRPVTNLNELEWIKGEVWANVWQTDRIARIAPDSGKVVGWIDLNGLLPQADRTGNEDVLNGIAYDAAADRIFVTGKLWPKLYEIRLKRK